jgi:hypothetical protein
MEAEMLVACYVEYREGTGRYEPGHVLLWFVYRRLAGGV